MKLNKLLIISVLLSVLLLAAVSAAGAATLVSPADNNNYTTTLTFNCTSAMEKALNASLLYNASGGAATTYLTTVTNTSANQSDFVNTAVSIASLTDTATYNFTCIMDNSTDIVYTTAVDGITIDNTAPSVVVARERYSVDRGSTQEITFTISDTIDSSPTNTCTVTKTGGDTISVTSSPYVLDANDLNWVGTYTWSCTSSDYTGNSQTSSVTFLVADDDGEGVPTGNGNLISLSGGTFILLIIIVSAIAAIVIVVLLVNSGGKSSKKRKRR